MPRRTLFVTTALPYANGPFHIGHIMEYIQADIWVRFQRMQGHDVHFVCADDAQCAPVMLAAEAKDPRRSTGRPRRGDTAEDSRYRRIRRQGFPPELRSLAQHRLAGERRTVAGHLPPAQGGWPDLFEDGRAVLRPGQVDVPAGPLHQGRVPCVRRQGSIRRFVRGLRLGLCADRSEKSVFNLDRCHTGAEVLGALFFPAVGSAMRLLSPSMDADPAGCSPGGEQGARVAG